MSNLTFDDTNFDVMHYGVVGMKWRQHKQNKYLQYHSKNGKLNKYGKNIKRLYATPYSQKMLKATEYAKLGASGGGGFTGGIIGAIAGYSSKKDNHGKPLKAQTKEQYKKDKNEAKENWKAIQEYDKKYSTPVLDEYEYKKYKKREESLNKYYTKHPKRKPSR